MKERFTTEKAELKTDLEERLTTEKANNEIKLSVERTGADVVIDLLNDKLSDLNDEFVMVATKQ